MNLSAEQLAAIDAQLIAGDIIAAIREVRGFTGAQLREANSFVDGRLEWLRKVLPSRFASGATPSTPDPNILRQIELLPDHQLTDFRSALKQIEQLLYGFNYAVTLSVNAVTVPFIDLPINELMLSVYPASTPHLAIVLPIRAAELVTNVTTCLTYAGTQSSGPQFTADRLKKLSETLLPDYWRQLSALTPLDSSRIYTYGSDTGLPGYYVYWFFAYLVHYPNANRCVVITGMSCD